MTRAHLNLTISQEQIHPHAINTSDFITLLPKVTQRQQSSQAALEVTGIFSPKYVLTIKFASKN
jgi:hypothetical protein